MRNLFKELSQGIKEVKQHQEGSLNLKATLVKQDYSKVEARVRAYMAGGIENISTTWEIMDKPKTFIEYWMNVTGKKAGSEEFKDAYDWIIKRELTK